MILRVKYKDNTEETMTVENFLNKYKGKVTVEFYSAPFTQHNIIVDDEKLIVTVL